MPEWLIIVLAIIGAVPVIGYFVWVTKGTFQVAILVTTVEELAASVQKISDNCVSRKLETTEAKELFRKETAVLADGVRMEVVRRIEALHAETIKTAEVLRGVALSTAETLQGRVDAALTKQDRDVGKVFDKLDRSEERRVGKE